jgi:hypothetical protein
MNRRELLKFLGLAATTSVLHWVPTAIAGSYGIVTRRASTVYRLVSMYASGRGSFSAYGSASLFRRGDLILRFAINKFGGAARWIPRLGEELIVDDLNALELRADRGVSASVVLANPSGKFTVVTTYEELDVDNLAE